MEKKILSDRELMLLAIEVMNKSINEPREDGKVPPKVGAVLLFPNGEYESAYRGELREGDHAEYTLIERKLGNMDLSDCILFTTLEPCVERNPPKSPCCKRTTNARIKKVFVGIEDPDPTVDGKGIKHLRKHSVEVKMFDRDLQQIIENENKTFIKQALERKHIRDEEIDLKGPLENSIPNFDKSKFSEVALQKFIDEAQLPYKVTDDKLWEYLSDFGAMEWDEKNNRFNATGYGILLFGANPRAKFNHAVLKASVTYAGGKTESKDFPEPLVLIPELIEEWLHKVLPLAKDVTNFKRKDIPDYPIDVLREAIINAIVHRDYENTSASSAIVIDDDIIRIDSPGEPLPSISIDELNSFSAPSLRRNPIITYVFSLMNYVEEKGFGMKTFKVIKEQYGLPLPQYTYKNPFLTLTFARNIEAIKSFVLSESINDLSKDELEAFDCIRNTDTISKADFVLQTKLTTRTAERMLKKFSDLGLIVMIGSGKNTKYKANK